MSDWNPLDHLVEAKHLSSLGLSEKAIASKMNMDVNAIRWHRKNVPEFNKAIVDGLDETIIQAAIVIKELIYAGDFKAAKFFLEKKGGWGDLQTENVSLPSHETYTLTKVVKE